MAFLPSAYVVVGSQIQQDGLYLSPPIVIPAVAEDFNEGSQETIDGRYLKTRGEMHGNADFKLQDTYKTGTGGRTGKAFTVVTGTWQDDWKSPWYDVYGLAMLDNTPNVVYDIVATSSDADVVAAEIILKREVTPAGSTTAHSAAQNYCYLELGYQSTNKVNYRIAMEFGRPIRLEYSDDAGTTWQKVAVAGDVPNTEVFLKGGDGYLHIHVKPNLDTGEMWVDLDKTVVFHHAPKGTRIKKQESQTDTRSLLPQGGKIRLSGKQGTISMLYFPLRFQKLTVKKAKTTPPRATNRGADTWVTGNGTAQPAQGQKNIVTLDTTDGSDVGVTVESSLEDAGDGLGSSTEPRLADVQILIPAQHILANDGIPTTLLKTMRVQELLVWDDAMRVVSSSAQVTANNFWGDYTGSVGQFQTAIWGSNDGYTFWPRLWGVAGHGANGLAIQRKDPTRLFTMPVSDLSCRMMVPMGQRVIFDGWALSSVVRFCLECGNCHPYLYGRTLPLYVPPEGTLEAPYGPAGYDFDDPSGRDFILPKGSGKNPRYLFTEEWTPWGILQSLVTDLSDYQGFPFYMGFDQRDNATYGRSQFRFEPFNPFNLLISEFFSSNPEYTGGILMYDFQVHSSVAQMRTEVCFQGLDAATYELLQAYLPVSSAWFTNEQVLTAVGYRYPWVERSARFADEDFIKAAATSAAYQASLPSVIQSFTCAFVPTLFPGDLIMTFESQAYNGLFLGVVTEIHHDYGISDLSGESGMLDCVSHITARALENYAF